MRHHVLDKTLVVFSSNRSKGSTSMCYSAQVLEDYRTYLRALGGHLDIADFVRLYVARGQGAKVKIAKGMDVAFSDPQTDDERRIKALIDTFDAAESTRLEQEIFKQKKRLVDAERVLQSRTTKKALEDRRIATEKIGWSLGKLADLRRTQPKERDARIFPGWYAPVMVMEDGRRTLKPMRYQCRLAGKPAFYDTKYPGCYNARRDNLEGFWKEQFGFSHGLMVANAFFENVSRHNLERRELVAGEKEENVVLEFRPVPTQYMLVACLWSHWTGPDGEELLSFAAITDEPPPEIAAAGHDRCIIPIKAENIDRWLSPDRSRLGEQYAILDDRKRPYYEHRMAA
jgi:putative SOS response-associated peptidase YedK